MVNYPDGAQINEIVKTLRSTLQRECEQFKDDANMTLSARLQAAIEMLALITMETCAISVAMKAKELSEDEMAMLYKNSKKLIISQVNHVLSAFSSSLLVDPGSEQG